MIEQKTNHAATAVSRIVQQYKSKPRVQALIEVTAEQLQEIEDALAGVRDARDKSTATGVNLDQVGAEVGAIRSGFGDSDFRDIIDATIAANWSDGEESDLTALLQAFYGVGASLSYQEWGRATAIYYITDYPLAFEPRFVASFLHKAKTAGTRVFLHYETHATLPFALSTQGAVLEAGSDGLANIAQTVGGYLSGVEAA